MEFLFQFIYLVWQLNYINVGLEISLFRAFWSKTIQKSWYDFARIEFI